MHSAALRGWLTDTCGGGRGSVDFGFHASRSTVVKSAMQTGTFVDKYSRPIFRSRQSSRHLGGRIYPNSSNCRSSSRGLYHHLRLRQAVDSSSCSQCLSTPHPGRLDAASRSGQHPVSQRPSRPCQSSWGRSALAAKEWSVKRLSLSKQRVQMSRPKEERQDSALRSEGLQPVSPRWWLSLCVH